MSQPSKPIRVALIGLSSTPADQYEGTNWAASAHLPYLLKSPHFEIAALLNSSVESAQRSIEKHGLPGSVKAYGRPEDVAADPSISLVVCNTRVDRHFSTVKPSIIAGKDVFVEWPLEKNLEIAKEMSELAKKHGGRTIVGLQGRYSEPVVKVRELVWGKGGGVGEVGGGRVGKVLGSTLFAALGNSGRTERKNVRYFLDREVGGNTLSIHFWHAMECVVSVLGEFKTHTSYLMNQHPTKDIVSSASSISTPDSTIVQASAPNTVPDQHLFQGITEHNVPFSMHRRGGAPFPGTAAVEWRIQGEKGEIRVTSEDYFIHMGHPRPVTRIELFVEGEGVCEVFWGKENEDDDGGDEVGKMDLPVIARGIARLYEGYRKREWVPDFELAVKRHEVVEEMWRKYDEDVKQGLTI
ncbi:hypothetical protein ONS95_002124 [Cadophora gregata]|uniref:uncharacterized protein n=1 Tax=Cadophora gregata TaxID=51156 RepID=UPI0026DD8DD6|nr:uncharacterized protein ONS95_002124 [Cadophora gregata]KAK0109430.1 hypothetical protein ONS95_002124 [Cadophora gregata]KAK0110942.1 hypothetical protein ONS96_002527 [Cadophora gregata f. sp. sojae]